MTETLAGVSPSKTEDLLEEPSLAEAAWAAFEEFEEKWAKPYPAIGQLWRNAWELFVPFLDYDVEIRTVLCSTNAIWVFESTCWPRRCFPDWRSSRRALTLNAIDAGRLSWTRSVGLAA